MHELNEQCWSGEARLLLSHAQRPRPFRALRPPVSRKSIPLSSRRSLVAAVSANSCELRVFFFWYIVVVPSSHTFERGAHYV